MTSDMTGGTARPWLVPFLATLVSMTALQTSNLGFSPLLPLIQRDFSMTFSQLGLFTGMYGLLAIVMSVPAGLLAKQVGEKRALIGGLTVVAGGLILLGRARGFGDAMIWRGFWIAGYRIAFVCVLTALAMTSPPSLKGRSMGLLGATSAMASVIGAPIGGWVGRDFGWRAGVLWYAGAAIAGAAIIMAFYRRTGGDTAVVHGHAVGSAANATRSQSAFRTPIVWALACLLGIGGVGQFSVTAFVPSVARSVFGLDPVAAGLIISTGYLCAVLASPIIGVLADRFGVWRVMAIVFVVLIVAAIGMTSTSLPVFRIATAVTLAGGFSAINQLYGIAGAVMRGREVANVMGVVSLGAGIFGYAGPQLLGALRDWTGKFSAGFYAVALADVITLVLILALRRRAI
jgi:predicted MFS family arabinose efflux permease